MVTSDCALQRLPGEPLCVFVCLPGESVCVFVCLSGEPVCVRVSDGPTVETVPQSGLVVAERGTDEILQCTADGKPQPSITWRKQVSHSRMCSLSQPRGPGDRVLFIPYLQRHAAHGLVPNFVFVNSFFMKMFGSWL